MIDLNLSDAERETLIEILETAHSELRMEIADTDRKDFRDMLRFRKDVLAKTLRALRGEAAG